MQCCLRFSVFAFILYMKFKKMQEQGLIYWENYVFKVFWHFIIPKNSWMLQLRVIQILNLWSNLTIYMTQNLYECHITDVSTHAWTLTNQKRSTCQAVTSLNAAVAIRITSFRISLGISKQRTCLICCDTSLAICCTSMVRCYAQV